MNKRVAFFGLGLMGCPMAINLLKAGFEIVTFPHMTQNPDFLERFRKEGGIVAGSYQEALRNTRYICSILLNNDTVREFYSNPEVCDNIEDNAVILEMTSCSPQVIKEMTEKFGDRGIEIMDGPVSGGVIGAENASLTIMCAGKKDIHEELMPILEAMGKKVDLLTENPGDGKAIKAINQMLVATYKVASCEAIRLAKANDLDLETVKNTIASSSGNHGQLTYDFDVMFREEDPKVMFSLANLTKDVNIAYDLSHGENYPLLEVLRTQFNKANRKHGRENCSSVYKAYTED